jgi:hypothetical protein
MHHLLVIPAKAGVQLTSAELEEEGGWIPAFAGMTV